MSKIGRLLFWEDEFKSQDKLNYSIVYDIKNGEGYVIDAYNNSNVDKSNYHFNYIEGQTIPAEKKIKDTKLARKMHPNATIENGYLLVLDSNAEKAYNMIQGYMEKYNIRINDEV